MACDKGLIPWNGKCLTPAEFIKESTGGNKGGSTPPSTATKPTDTKATDKKGGFDWVAVLAILAGAAPAVIAATKGQKQDSAYSNPAYQQNDGSGLKPPSEDSASIPVWVWAIAGVIIAVVLYVILRPKK